MSMHVLSHIYRLFGICNNYVFTSEKKCRYVLFNFRQLNMLVKERHDSFARLKTTEDLLEALRGENEILKAGVGGSVSTKNSNAQNSKLEFIASKLICRMNEWSTR